MPYARARGAAPLVAVLVAGFALIAAGLLIGTVVTGWTINGHALAIKRHYGRVRENTRLVALAASTESLARSIAAASRPWPGQMATIHRQTRAIRGSAVSIQGHVDAIDPMVVDINSNVREIGRTAGYIRGWAGLILGQVSSIHDGVGGVDGSAGAIDARAAAVDRRALSISAGAVAIGHDLRAVRGVAGQIRGGVVGINRRVGVVIGQARGIETLLGGIFGQVGRPSAGDPHGFRAPGGRSIDGHANAIDCNPLILGSRCGQ